MNLMCKENFVSDDRVLIMEGDVIACTEIVDLDFSVLSYRVKVIKSKVSKGQTFELDLHRIARYFKYVPTRIFQIK